MARHHTEAEKQAAPEEPAPAAEELQQQINDLKKQEEARQQQLRMQAQQYQKQLQNVTGAAISTMGQIVQLEDVLAEQKRERHHLEGMLRALSQMLPQQ